MTDSPQCTFCENEIESPDHFFYNCEINNNILLRSSPFLAYGMGNIKLEPFCHQDFVIGNLLILVAKFYIYRCKLNGVKPVMRGFLKKIKNRSKSEQYTIYNNNNNISFICMTIII